MRPEQEKKSIIRAANLIRIAICGQNRSIIFVTREYINAPKFAAHSLLSKWSPIHFVITNGNGNWICTQNLHVQKVNKYRSPWSETWNRTFATILTPLRSHFLLLLIFAYFTFVFASDFGVSHRSESCEIRLFFASKRNKIFASISNFASKAKVRAHPRVDDSAFGRYVVSPTQRIAYMGSRNQKYWVDSLNFKGLHAF